MVITFYFLLIFVTQEVVRQGFRRAEIEAGQGDVLQISPRNTVAFDGQINIGKICSLWLRTSLCTPSRLK